MCACVCVCVSSMVEVEEVYNKKGAELSEVVRPIKEVNRKHQQVMCNTVMCVCVGKIIDKTLAFCFS